LVNFNQAPLPLNKIEAIANSIDLSIQPEDLLQINLSSFSAEAIKPFASQAGGVGAGQQNNMMMMQGTGSESSNSLELFTGFFVDKAGYINYPVLGRVKVGGLTLNDARDTLLRRIIPYVSDAVLDFRFLNLKITMLGEVTRPGLVRLSNKRVTLLEAIGMAGDLTPYADRKNILLMREKDGQRQYVPLNLQDPAVFVSPYFYLEQNDFIYIPPTKAKVGGIADQTNRLLTFGSAGLSLITLIVALFRR
jgi:polysaccharide export outer membrane protein